MGTLGVRLKRHTPYPHPAPQQPGPRRPESGGSGGATLSRLRSLKCCQPPLISPVCEDKAMWPPSAAPFSSLPPEIAVLCQLSFPFGWFVPLQTPLWRTVFQQHFRGRAKCGGEGRTGSPSGPFPAAWGSDL